MYKLILIVLSERLPSVKPWTSTFLSLVNLMRGLGVNLSGSPTRENFDLALIRFSNLFVSDLGIPTIIISKNSFLMLKIPFLSFG